jgi:hypothetical protein
MHLLLQTTIVVVVGMQQRCGLMGLTEIGHPRH